MSSRSPSPQLVAALFVSRKGPYWGRPDVDAWDEQRDARLYAGPYPVVAHPPCARWCRLAKFVASRTNGRLAVGDDAGCFAAALAAVKRWGGVLEHPAWSIAWAAHGLIAPNLFGWTHTIDGLWVCEVSQAAYGHRAAKATWLCYSGATPPDVLTWAKPKGTMVVGYAKVMKGGRIWRDERRRLSPTETSITPPAFSEALLSLARRSR